MARRRPLALLAVWVAGAVVATATGVLAVRQVADRVSDAPPPPLSAAGVETALAEATGAATTPPATPAPSATATPASVPPAATPARSFSGPGGSIGVACDGALPRLVYATPAQGYRVDDRREDAERVEVRFRSDDDDHRLRVVCGPGGPVQQDD